MPEQPQQPEVLLNQRPKEPAVDAATMTHQAATDRDSESSRRTEEEKEISGIREKLGLPTASEIKQKFLGIFTDEDKSEFVSTFNQATNNPEATKLFEKNISGNITFVAYKAEKRFSGGIMFRIMEGEAQSQSLGISGSSLLQKIEEYFKILQESNALPPATTLSIEAGQVTVAEWAQKNGYGFKNTAEEALFNSIVSI